MANPARYNVITIIVIVMTTVAAARTFQTDAHRCEKRTVGIDGKQEKGFTIRVEGRRYMVTDKFASLSRYLRKTATY